MIRLRSGLFALVAAVALACDKTPGAPADAGSAVASLTTPAKDDGGLLVRLRGPGFAAVRPASSAYLVYWRLAGPEDARVLVLGDIEPGPLFTVDLKAANRLEEYSASIEQVAARDDDVREDLSGYRLELSAPE